MIEITDLKKTYGKTVAVNGLSLKINDGEIFALLGLNGAGKSTTIKILCTLLKKDGGKIFVNGLDLDENATAIKREISLSPQETAVAANLTVEENLKLIAALYDVKDGDAADDMIKKFSLESKRKTLAKRLSGGQKRRLSLAMAFIVKPRILILDEPTLGLDVKVRRDLWELIREFAKTATVIITTHYLEEAEALADRIAVMRRGKLTALGTAQEITRQAGTQNFEDAFLMLAGVDDE
ncbi:MAG: ABC transporter ATP-binding protein [Clostridia bacterium]|nr:ABC transporter ATP-binding protein [Clostridia bacterium]